VNLAILLLTAIVVAGLIGHRPVTPRPAARRLRSVPGPPTR
jgi:hypothetical protein